MAIKVSLNFSNQTHRAFLARCRLIFERMNGNPIVRKPPVALEDFKVMSDQYEDAVNRALDSKKAISERDGLRGTLVGMIRQLGTHVVNVAKDAADVLGCGFEVAYATRQRRGLNVRR